MKTLADFKKRCREGVTVKTFIGYADGTIVYIGERKMDRVTSTSVLLVPGNSWFDFPTAKEIEIIDTNTVKIRVNEYRSVYYRFIN